MFWWILFLVLQQAERFFLLPQALFLERPTAGVLFKTLVTGFRADLITATIGILVVITCAGAIGLLLSALPKRSGRVQISFPYRVGLMASGGAVALLFVILLTFDMQYYHYNQQHLDFVFFEYLDDLFAAARGSGLAETQAARQTNAELNAALAWRVLGFVLVEGAAGLGWWFCFRRAVEPALTRFRAAGPYYTNLALTMALAASAAGFHLQGPYAIRIIDINSTRYYILAQNPILYAAEALRAALEFRLGAERPWIREDMHIDEALLLTQQALGRGAAFPDPRYPLIREGTNEVGVHFDKPANVLLIFVEGLDRRYLGRTIPDHDAPPSGDGATMHRSRASEPHGIRLTPFLDRLKDDSLYFENFFANGVQTARGLFASFCSYYPTQGPSEMKTRYAHDYLCLPALLRKSGYHTEMVIGQHRDLNRLQLFMARNGLHEVFDESNFPAGVERTGLGISDGALFDQLRSRIETLQSAGRPYFLSTLTVNTHHPFTVPMTHPEVRALSAGPDRYVAALRYLDLEIERWFVGLQRDGLLRNTIVFILGDHGRHEAVGPTDVERKVGHFMSPLFIWIDPSLRTRAVYRPRVISTVASQVDLAPTILAVNGLTPRMSPFVGRDLSCLFHGDCAQDNLAYLSSVYDDLVGLADQHGLLLYSLRKNALHETDIGLKRQAMRRAVTDPLVAGRYRRLLALYVTSNLLLDRNQIWSATHSN